MVSTHLKNMIVKMGSSSPIFGVKKKYIWSCHHPEKNNIGNIIPISVAILEVNQNHLQPPWLRHLRRHAFEDTLGEEIGCTYIGTKKLESRIDPPEVGKRKSLLPWVLCNKPRKIDMGVSKNNGTPQISHFYRVFHYKPSILGYPYFWKHPHRTWA